MTRWMYPPEHLRTLDSFDPVIAGARYQLSRELSLEIWEQVRAEATDSTGRCDEARARRRFHELAAGRHAQSGKPAPDVGRRTRVGVELDGDAFDAWRGGDRSARIPGRTNLVLAEAQRWKQPERAWGDARGEAAPSPTYPEPPRASEAAPDAEASLAAHRPGSPDRVRGIHGPLRPPPPVLTALFGGTSLRGPRRRTDENQLSRFPVPMPRPSPEMPAAVMRSAERTEIGPDAAALVARARTGGVPLDGALRTALEAAFGVPLDDVRVHTGAQADAAARALGARAFAIGRDVFFRSGSYEPERREGQRLIAHEVVHTVQARGIAAPLSDETAVSQPGDALEQQADAFADAFARRLDEARTNPPSALSRSSAPQADVEGRLDAEGKTEAAGALAVPPLAPAPAGTPPIFRFYPPEHVELGDAASGNESTDIEVQFDDGTLHKLSFGQLVALADVFDSVADLKAKAALKPAIAVQYALSWKLRIGKEPAGHDDIKKQVRDHILEILATNLDHFGDEAKGAYKKEHANALAKAFEAGAGNDQAAFGEAVATEAFCQHYLSDLFAGGHIRTPRREIKDWYDTQFPRSNDRFVNNMTSSLMVYFKDHDAIPWWVPDDKVSSRIKGNIVAMGGAAIATASVGDLVGAAFHNLDSSGLQVVSDVDENGNVVAGGHHWEAKGDDHLHDAGGEMTKKMAVAAMTASRRELDAARDAGKKATGGKYMAKPDLLAARDAAIKGLAPYRAERFLPREDTGNAKNKQYNWHWGQLDSDLAAELTSVVKKHLIGELRNKASAQPATKIVDEDSDISVGDLHLGTKHVHLELPLQAALVAYCDHLDGNPLQGLVEVLGGAKAQGVPPPKPPPPPDPDPTHVGAWDSEEW